MNRRVTIDPPEDPPPPVRTVLAGPHAPEPPPAVGPIRVTSQYSIPAGFVQVKAPLVLAEPNTWIFGDWGVKAAPAVTADVTNAVVATCVVLVSAAAVGAVGVPVRAGEGKLLAATMGAPPVEESWV
jgi:hypothetical protein